VVLGSSGRDSLDWLDETATVLTDEGFGEVVAVLPVFNFGMGPEGFEPPID
jgi:hypothetical protein